MDKSILGYQPLRDIDTTIARLSQSLSTAADAEESLMLARLKRARLRALAVVARAQTFLSKVEVLVTAKELKFELGKMTTNTRKRGGHRTSSLKHKTSPRNAHKSSHKELTNSNHPPHTTPSSSRVTNKSNQKSLNSLDNNKSTKVNKSRRSILYLKKIDINNYNTADCNNGYSEILKTDNNEKVQEETTTRQKNESATHKDVRETNPRKDYKRSKRTNSNVDKPEIVRQTNEENDSDNSLATLRDGAVVDSINDIFKEVMLSRKIKQEPDTFSQSSNKTLHLYPTSDIPNMDPRLSSHRFRDLLTFENDK